jgi:hypothetical protein
MTEEGFEGSGNGANVLCRQENHEHVSGMADIRTEQSKK